MATNGVVALLAAVAAAAMLVGIGFGLSRHTRRARGDR
jgi:hypothetical protein